MKGRAAGWRMERRQTEIDSLLSQGRMNKQAQGREGGRGGAGDGGKWGRDAEQEKSKGWRGATGGRVRLPVIKP